MEGGMINPFWLSVCAATVALLPGWAQADSPPLPTLAPPSTAVSSVPVARAAMAVLRPGEPVTLRIRQVMPADGLSPGERLLNGRPPIRPGDRFLAEIIDPPCNPPALVGGTVANVEPPRRCRRQGRLTLQMTQLVETIDGGSQIIPWNVDTVDRRFSTWVRRAMLTTLFGLEGADIGASFGAQMAQGNPIWIGGGAGAGLLLGLGYAWLQRGSEASLEPGDTFRVVVGTMSYQPVPGATQTILYPAPDPLRRKGEGKP